MTIVPLVLLALSTAPLAACSSGGGPGAGASGGAAGTTGAGGQTGGAFTLRTFVAPPSQPGPRSILFTASGETLAYAGYAFPPALDGDAAFVDGWQITFDRLLATVDKITLSANPDLVPTDQSKTGALVAEVDGPWAVDLHPQGPLSGKGGGDETAVPIAFLANQNRNGNVPFDTASGTRYAFGFALVAASTQAQNVNLNVAALPDYQQMVRDGCTVLYVGTATFKGASCAPTSPEFDRLPRTVRFNLCFRSPTTYVNCQNPDNQASHFAGEEFIRGIAMQDNSSVIGQVTIHTDHPFWESTIHDSPAHFDQLAAQVTDADGPGDGDGGATVAPTVTMQDLVGVDYTGFEDKQGNPLPWRSCLPASLYPQGHYDAPAGQMSFDAQSIAKIAAGADPATGFRDYADFATYNQSTQGHLNSDGLCFVMHDFAAPR